MAEIYNIDTNKINAKPYEMISSSLINLGEKVQKEGASYKDTPGCIATVYHDNILESYIMGTPDDTVSVLIHLLTRHISNMAKDNKFAAIIMGSVINILMAQTQEYAEKAGLSTEDLGRLIDENPPRFYHQGGSE